RLSILGHSVGGHSDLALVALYPRNIQNIHRSCLAFSPACAPSVAPWGIRASNRYLANGVEGRYMKLDAT
ncbi:hypothetical protein EDC04DRAFT_2524402, partial [Pisolithus marmoratus]